MLLEQLAPCDLAAVLALAGEWLATVERVGVAPVVAGHRFLEQTAGEGQAVGSSEAAGNWQAAGSSPQAQVAADNVLEELAVSAAELVLPEQVVLGMVPESLIGNWGKAP